jgi:uncharacterized protein YceK
MRPLFALLLLAVLLTGCSTAIEGRPVAGAELTARAPVTEAWKKDVTDAIATLGSALGTAGQAMTEGDYPTMKDGCEDIKAATQGIEDQLPSEDDEVNRELQGAVDEYRSFADICLNLTPDSTSAEIDRLEKTLDEADGHVREAMALLGIDMPGS